MEVQQCTPSLSQAQRMKTLHQQGKLELDMIIKILGEAKANQREKISFNYEKIRQFFPRATHPSKWRKVLSSFWRNGNANYNSAGKKSARDKITSIKITG